MTDYPPQPCPDDPDGLHHIGCGCLWGDDPATELLARCDAVIDRYGPHAAVVADAHALRTLAADSLELHRLRTVLAGLPDDDWRPDDHDALEAEIATARAALP